MFCVHVKSPLPPGDNPIAVNKYYYYYKLEQNFWQERLCYSDLYPSVYISGEQLSGQEGQIKKKKSLRDRNKNNQKYF